MALMLFVLALSAAIHSVACHRVVDTDLQQVHDRSAQLFEAGVRDTSLAMVELRGTSLAAHFGDRDVASISTKELLDLAICLSVRDASACEDAGVIKSEAARSLEAAKERRRLINDEVDRDIRLYACPSQDDVWMEPTKD